MFRRYHSSDLKTLADTIIGLSGEGTEVLWASPDAPLEVLLHTAPSPATSSPLAHGPARRSTLPPSQDRFGRDFYARLREGGFEVVDLSETDEVLEARELVVPTYEYSGRGPVTVVRMTQTQRGGSRRRPRL